MQSPINIAVGCKKENMISDEPMSHAVPSLQQSIDSFVKEIPQHSTHNMVP